MATIKLKDESSKTFSIDGVCYTKGDYRLQYNAKREVLIIPKAVANISNLSGLPFKTPTAWTYFVDLNDDPYNSFEEFSLAISDAINFNLGGATPQYKVYTALLSQSGTNDPVAVVLENTLGQTITWAYNDVGSYIFTSSIPLFEQGKVQLIQGSGNTSSLISLWGYYNSPTEFIIDNFDLGNVGDGSTYPNIGASMVDGIMEDQFIEIRVYN